MKTTMVPMQVGEAVEKAGEAPPRALPQRPVDDRGRAVASVDVDVEETVEATVASEDERIARLATAQPDRREVVSETKVPHQLEVVKEEVGALCVTIRATQYCAYTLQCMYLHVPWY